MQSLIVEKDPRSSNQRFDPGSLASCFVCAATVSKHLNWLGFCFGFVSLETLRKRTLCK